MGYHVLQYVRKMTKLMNAGKLPAHVDPAAIINAPPSKMPRLHNVQPGAEEQRLQEKADNPGADGQDTSEGVTAHQAADVPEYTEQVSGDPDAEAPHNAEERMRKKSKSKLRPTSSDSDSDLASLDDIFATSSESNSVLDYVRSSSPSCDAKQDLF